MIVYKLLNSEGKEITRSSNKNSVKQLMLEFLSQNKFVYIETDDGCNWCLKTKKECSNLAIDFNNIGICPTCHAEHFEASFDEGI